MVDVHEHKSPFLLLSFPAPDESRYTLGVMPGDFLPMASGPMEQPRSSSMKIAAVGDHVRITRLEQLKAKGWFDKE